jgi:hypothetical protein
MRAFTAKCGGPLRRTLAVLIFMLLVIPLPRAMAEGSGSCYPPPCTGGAAAGGNPLVASPVSGPSPVVGASGAAAPADRSPVPFVLLGLLSVTGFLAVVASRRRYHISRRLQPGPEPAVLVSPAPSLAEGPQGTVALRR